MISHKVFWNKERMSIAKKCERKNTRLFYSVMANTFYIVKKFDDGSILHARETELFQSEEIKEIDKFIKKYKV